MNHMIVQKFDSIKKNLIVFLELDTHRLDANSLKVVLGTEHRHNSLTAGYYEHNC